MVFRETARTAQIFFRDIPDFLLPAKWRSPIGRSPGKCALLIGRRRRRRRCRRFPLMFTAAVDTSATVLSRFYGVLKETLVREGGREERGWREGGEGELNCSHDVIKKKLSLCLFLWLLVFWSFCLSLYCLSQFSWPGKRERGRERVRGNERERERCDAIKKEPKGWPTRRRWSNGHNAQFAHTHSRTHSLTHSHRQRGPTRTSHIVTIFSFLPEPRLCSV